MHDCEHVGLDFLQHAPSLYRNAIALDLSPDDTFAFLARADTWPRWASVITDVAYTSPEPHGVGTTRRVTMRGGLVGDEEFLQWEPGRQLAFRFNACSTRAVGAFLEHYLLEPTSTGTELTWTLAQRLAGPSKVFAPLSGPVSNLMFRRFLRNLQRLTAAS